MRFAHFDGVNGPGLAVETSDGWRGRTHDEPHYPGALHALLAEGHDALRRAHTLLSDGPVVDVEQVTVKPPIAEPGKIICVGLNFLEHASEGGFKVPEVPEVFARFSTSLVGATEPLLRPVESEQLDF